MRTCCRCHFIEPARDGALARSLPPDAHLAACAPHRACRFDWLSDEIEGISEAEDVARTLALLSEAVQDYLSVPLWAQYLE